MRKQYIQAIVDAACETADTIVGARQGNTDADARAMHELIFWDMIARKLPNVSVAELLAMLD